MTVMIIQPDPTLPQPFAFQIDHALDWARKNPNFLLMAPIDQEYVEDCIKSFANLPCVVDFNRGPYPSRCYIANSTDGQGDGDWTNGDDVINIGSYSARIPGLLRQLGVLCIFVSSGPYDGPGTPETQIIEA